MADKTSIHVISFAFRENFDLAKMSPDWLAVPGQKDVKVWHPTDGGAAYVYQFGAVVFFGFESDEVVGTLDLLKMCGVVREPHVTSEEFTVEVSGRCKPRVTSSSIIVELTPGREAVIALTIAQSAALELYEQLVSKTKTSVMELVDSMAEKGKIALSPVALHKRLGYAMAIRGEVVGMLHILDKPDLIWEDSLFDAIYDDLRTVFDLPVRFRALEHKLQIIKDDLEIIVETVKYSKLYNADLAIIAIIVFESVLSIIALMATFHVWG
jgi:uncharacterized Rmd1/YagE family protein